MIRDTLTEAVRGALAQLDVPVAEAFVVERPARREHGDWSTNAALVAAKPARRNPRELAAQLAELLTSHPPAHVACTTAGCTAS